MKRERPPQIFAPLGNRPYFRSLGIKDELIHTLDWWEGRRVEINVQPEATGVQVNVAAGTSVTNMPGTKVAFDVTCTPAQHFTGRGLFDRCQTLWASWAIQEVIPSENAGNTEGAKVYFAGDTGYRAVRDGQDEDAVPTCPVFKEIGERFGGFDFAMIPIGCVKWSFHVNNEHLMSIIELISHATSCPRSTALRATVLPCSRIFVQRKHWACTGGELRVSMRILKLINILKQNMGVSK